MDYQCSLPLMFESLDITDKAFDMWCNFCLCGNCETAWFQNGWTCEAPASIVTTVKCRIGLCGNAIVIWCNGVFPCATKCAHCTVCWRQTKFTNTELDIVIGLRARWLQGADSVGCNAVLWRRTAIGGVLYELSDCALRDFVKVVRQQKPEWCEKIALPEPHITVLPPRTLVGTLT